MARDPCEALRVCGERSERAIDGLEGGGAPRSTAAAAAGPRRPCRRRFPLQKPVARAGPHPSTHTKHREPLYLCPPSSSRNNCTRARASIKRETCSSRHHHLPHLPPPPSAALRAKPTALASPSPSQAQRKRSTTTTRGGGAGRSLPARARRRYGFRRRHRHRCIGPAPATAAPPLRRPPRRHGQLAPARRHRRGRVWDCLSWRDRLRCRPGRARGDQAAAAAGDGRGADRRHGNGSSSNSHNRAFLRLLRPGRRRVCGRGRPVAAPAAPKLGAAGRVV